MKRLITVVIVIALLAVGVYAFLQYQRQSKAASLDTYQTIAASRGGLTATIGATGIVRANQMAILTWQTTGIVEEIEVVVGEEVTKDQVLASLELTSLPQNVIMAGADLVNAQKALDDLYTNADIAKVEAMRAISTYTKEEKDAQYQLDNFIPPTNQTDLEAVVAVKLMKERLDQAREAFEPYKYFSSGNSTRRDLKDALDEAQSDYNAAVKRLGYEYDLEVAQANLDKARQDYEKWKDGPDPDDIASTEARIAAAEATLKLARLTAPFNASVTDVQNKPGDQVSPGTIAFRIDDLMHLLLDVQVSEVDINRIRVGQDTMLSFDAILDREYKGTVIEVARVGTSAQGVVDFTVTIELVEVDEYVKPGMTAAVNIVVNQMEDVLLVPNRAVRVHEGQRVVYVLKNNQPTPVEIKLGASSDTMSEVLDGDLQVGDLIVLNPPLEFDSNGHPPFAR